MNESGVTGGKGFHTDDKLSGDADSLRQNKEAFEDADVQGAGAGETGDDSIAQDALENGRKVSKEPFHGDEQLEKDNIVTEQCYIHSKVGDIPTYHKNGMIR